MAAAHETATDAWNREREQLHAYWAGTPQPQSAGMAQPPQQVPPAQHYQWTNQGWVAPQQTQHQHYQQHGQQVPGQPTAQQVPPQQTSPQQVSPQQVSPQHMTPGHTWQGTHHPQAPGQAPYGQAAGAGATVHAFPDQPGAPPPGDIESSENPNETHVTIHPPGKLKHWLMAGAGALALIAAVGAFALRGGSEDPAATDETAEESVEGDEEPSPDELAFNDLEDRLENLEDDDDIIIIDDDNGGYGGYGRGYGGYGGGYGNRGTVIGDDNNDGIVIGDGDSDGIVLDGDPVDVDPVEETAEALIGDDELGDGDLVLTDSSGGDEPVIFPPCDTDGTPDGDAGADGDAGPDGATSGDGADTAPDAAGGGTEAATVDFPYSDDFSLGSPVTWAPLNGTWGLTGENYQQTDPDSFGNIAELELDLPDLYEATVDIAPLGDTVGGGMLIGQPTPGSRKGATVIDLTNDGTFLRWGTYDPDSGDYVYTGGVSVPEDFDASTAHTMAVRLESAKTTVALDGSVVAEFEATPSGRMGLFTSQSAVTFDNLVISDLS